MPCRPWSNSYIEITTKLASKWEDKFTVLSISSIFENLIQVINVSSWPIHDNLLSTGFLSVSLESMGGGLPRKDLLKGSQWTTGQKLIKTIKLIYIQ